MSNPKYSLQQLYVLGKTAIEQPDKSYPYPTDLKASSFYAGYLGHPRPQPQLPPDVISGLRRARAALYLLWDDPDLIADQHRWLLQTVAQALDAALLSAASH